MSNQHDRDDETMRPDQDPAGSSNHHQPPSDYDEDWDIDKNDDDAENSGGDAENSGGDCDNNKINDVHDRRKWGDNATAITAETSLSDKKFDDRELFQDDDDELLKDDIEELEEEDDDEGEEDDEGEDGDEGEDDDEAEDDDGGEDGREENEENENSSPTEPLTRLKTSIRTDGDDDDMSFMGSIALFPFEDPSEYKNLREAVAKSTPVDFFGQFCARMLTDALWETRRYQLVTAATIKTELERFSDPTANPETKVAAAVANQLDVLERLYRIIGGREHRVDAFYRLAQQHRANLGTLLRPPAEQVQDAEFREVDEATGDRNLLSEQARPEDKPDAADQSRQRRRQHRDRDR